MGAFTGRVFHHPVSAPVMLSRSEESACDPKADSSLRLSMTGDPASCRNISPWKGVGCPTIFFQNPPQGCRVQAYPPLTPNQHRSKLYPKKRKTLLNALMEGPGKTIYMNNFSEKVSFIWSVADLIRDTFKRSKYQD